MDLLTKPITTYHQLNLDVTNYVETKKLEPILKWAGGKEQELKHIIPNIPIHFENYYEPFVGGGAVFTAIQAKKYFINDKSNELINLYRHIAIKDDDNDLFFNALEEIIDNWNRITLLVENNEVFFIDLYKRYSKNEIDDIKLKNNLYAFISTNLVEFRSMFTSFFYFNTENFIKEIKINLLRKVKRMKILEQQKDILPEHDILANIETALKSAFYMYFRYLYNNTNLYNIKPSFKSAIFIFIRNFAYSGMFRYNSKGEFNVPYGGIGYNRKNFLKKVNYLKSKNLHDLLNSTNIENLDFSDFLHLHEPTNNDFIFLDPPYDTEFSTYAQNEFSKNDQIRLADYLLKKCKAKWMMVIKYTDFIFNLYNNKGLNIQSFDKTYLVSFMNRNDKNVEHLMITNY